jgi:hypothetical protein
MFPKLLLVNIIFYTQQFSVRQIFNRMSWNESKWWKLLPSLLHFRLYLVTSPPTINSFWRFPQYKQEALSLELTRCTIPIKVWMKPYYLFFRSLIELRIKIFLPMIWLIAHESKIYGRWVDYGIYVWGGSIKIIDNVDRLKRCRNSTLSPSVPIWRLQYVHG